MLRARAVPGYPNAMTIAANLAQIQSRIDAACARAGRLPSQVRLLPVSKTHPGSAVREAYAAGYHAMAENKVQDLVAKADELADLDVSWVFIGHLQRNKAKYLAPIASEFQGLESMPLAIELDKRCAAVGKQMDVLIEVNTSGESSKFGIEPDAVTDFAHELRACDALRVRGLMTIAANTDDAVRIAACFDQMRMLQQRLREDDRLDGTFDELSMGMSGDFELAIEHGSTCVRVGTAIFGARPYPTAL